MTGAPAEPTPARPLRLRSAWALTSSSNLIIGLVALVVSPIAARALETEGRGRLVAVQLVPQLLADLAALGLGFSIIHFGARHRNSIGQLLRWSVPRALAGGTIMFLAGQALAAPLAGGFASDERLIRIYLLICPLTALTVVGLESFRAVGDFRRWNAFVLARGLGWPAAVLSGVLRETPSITTIVFVHLALGVVLLSAVVAVAAHQLAQRVEEPPVDRRTFTRFGLASAVSAIPRSANAKLDQVVMTVIVARGNLGLYAAAVGWSALTIPVMRGLTGISMPHVSSASERSVRIVRTRQLVSVGVMAAVVLGCGAAAATYVLWQPVYGDDFAAARSAAMVLIPATLLLELNAMLANVLRSLDRPGLVAVLEASVLAVSTGALLVVLTFDEVLGPAVLSALTYGAACWLYLVFIARSLEVPSGALFDGGLLRDLPDRLRRRRG